MSEQQHCSLTTFNHVENQHFCFAGAEFTRRADVTFYPGNQRLSIVQTATGLDTQNYLNVDTHLQGSVPFITPGATVQMEPFKDTYHYYPSCKFWGKNLGNKYICTALFHDPDPISECFSWLIDWFFLIFCFIFIRAVNGLNLNESN